MQKQNIMSKIFIIPTLIISQNIMTKMSNEFLIENQMQFEKLDSRNKYTLEMPH